MGIPRELEQPYNLSRVPRRLAILQELKRRREKNPLAFNPRKAAIIDELDRRLKQRLEVEGGRPETEAAPAPVTPKQLSIPTAPVIPDFTSTAAQSTGTVPGREDVAALRQSLAQREATTGLSRDERNLLDTLDNISESTLGEVGTEAIKAGFRRLPTTIGNFLTMLPYAQPAMALEGKERPGLKPFESRMRAKDQAALEMARGIEQWANVNLPEGAPLRGKFMKPAENFLDYIDPKRMLKVAAENAPQMGMFMASSLINPGFGMAVMFAAEGGDVARSFAEMEAKGQKIDPVYKMLAPVVVGGINAALERVGLDKILEVAKVPGLKQRVVQWLIAQVTEGVTEGVQGVNSALADAGAKQRIDKNLWDEFVENAYAGWVLGLGASTSSGLLGAAFGDDPQKVSAARGKILSAIETSRRTREETGIERERALNRQMATEGVVQGGRPEAAPSQGEPPATQTARPVQPEVAPTISQEQPQAASTPVTAPTPSMGEVEQALREGKPVPADVLADYPDLVKQAEKPQAAAIPPIPRPAPSAVSTTTTKVKEDEIPVKDSEKLLALPDNTLGGIYRDWVAMEDPRVSAYPSNETLAKYAAFAKKIISGKRGVSLKPNEEFARFARIRLWQKSRKFGDLRSAFEAFRNGKDYPVEAPPKKPVTKPIEKSEKKGAEQPAKTSKIFKSRLGQQGKKIWKLWRKNMGRMDDRDRDLVEAQTWFIELYDRGRRGVGAGTKLGGLPLSYDERQAYEAGVEDVRPSTESKAEKPSKPVEGVKSAFQYGQEAFKAGIKRVPALDVEFTKTIKGPTGTANERLTEWLRGWDQANLAEPVPGVQAPSSQYGASNKIFTQDKAEAARELIKKKLREAQLGAGIDPELTVAGITLAGFHVEAGARKFAAFSKAMIDDLGEAVRPYLKSWYLAVRNYPEFDNEGMETEQEISAPAEQAAKPAVKQVAKEEAQNARPETQYISTALPDRDTGTRQLEGEQAETLPRTEEERESEQSVADVGAKRRGDAGERAPAVTRDEIPEGTRSGGEQPAEAGASAATTGEPGKRTGRRDDSVSRGKPRITHNGDFRITDDTGLGKGGKRQKFKDNIAAIRLLKKIESEGRAATPEEQSVLVKYVGWGGLAQEAFGYSRSSEQYTEEREALEELLTEDELDAARASTPNAHYTSPSVVRSIYSALKRFGFNGGKVIEPGSGIGNFVGLLPDELYGKTRFTAIEMDAISGRILKKLYPSVDLRLEPFQQTQMPDNFYDAMVGNVPFGNVNLFDPQISKKFNQKFSIHNFFIIKALQKVRPGGVMAFVTSRYTMDSESRDFRKLVGKQADLIGAIRLPKETFGENAQTEVVTDIIFLKKRAEGQPASSTKWTETKTIKGKDGGEIVVNEYYAAHPKMMIGDASLEGSMYGANEPTWSLKNADALPKEISDRTARLPENVYSKEKVKPPKEDVKQYVPGPEDVKQGGYGIVDGKIAIAEGLTVITDEFGVKRRVPNMRVLTNLSNAQEQKIRGMLGIRNAMREVFKTQINDDPLFAQATARDKLNKTYDDFVKKHGFVNLKENRKAFESDPDSYIVLALENFNPDTGKATKTDIFTKAVIEPRKFVTKADTASDAMVVSLAQKGQIDFELMSQLTGKDEATLQEELAGVAFPVPGADWQPADEYLSGNVREKLDAAREAAKIDDRFKNNVEALEKVQPEPLDASQIIPRLGSVWVPEDIVAQFAEHISGGQWNVRHLNTLGKWDVSSVRSAYWSNEALMTSKWGTGRRNSIELMGDALNLKTPVIYDRVNDSSVLNEEQTQLAQQKLQEVKDEFVDWVYRDPERRKRLVDAYNRDFNNIRLRNFNGDHLTFDGMSKTVKLRKHQVDAVWRILSGGNTLIGHAVGAGKTFTMIAAGMEARRMGTFKKPMYVVRKHMLEQFRKEFLQLYPNANILVADEENFHGSTRKQFMARIATGDWDAVIVTHPSLKFIPMSRESEAALLQEQIDEMRAAEDGLREQLGKKDPSIKEMAKARARIEAKLQALNATKRDDAVTFEQLGIDMMFVDESQNFKNLFYATKMNRVLGLGSQAGGPVTFDLYMKTRYISKFNGGERGVVFSTGTPISNSMSEMYLLMKYLQPQTLKANGLDHFDSWASTFGDVVTALERTSTGKFEPRSRFARFVNIPELAKMFRRFSDIKTADDLPELKKIVPVHKGGEVIPVISQSSPELEDFMSRLVKRAEQLHGRPEKGGDNHLNIATDARKAGLDMRLIDPNIIPSTTPKVEQAAENIFKVWRETQEQRSTQIVFADMSAPDKKKFNVYDELKRQLVSRGIPANEVAFIHDADTDAKKMDLFNKVNRGDVRVIVGSTPKLGEGTNIQRKLIAIHHLDAPWRPSDVEQRNGRIFRQGNENKEVYEFRNATERSFDTNMWQKLEQKQRFISQLMTSDLTIREAEDITDAFAQSAAEMKAITSGDPRILELVQLDTDIRKLELLRSAHRKEVYGLEDKVAKLPGEIESVQKRIAAYQSDVDLAEQTSEADFSLTLGKSTYDTRKDAGDAIIDAAKKHQQFIGKYRGFDIEVIPSRTSDGGFQIEPKIVIKGKEQYQSTVSESNVGTIAALDNRIKGIKDSLGAAQEKLAALQKESETTKAEVGKPFKQESALREKIARKFQIMGELAEEGKKEKTAATQQAESEVAAPVAEERAALQNVEKRFTATKFRQRLEQLSDAGRIKKDEVDLVDKITGLFAKRWAEWNGRTEDEFYGEAFEDIRASAFVPPVLVDKFRMPENADVKRSKVTGNVMFDSNGKAIINIFEGGNVAAVLHELGHVFRRYLPEQDSRTLRNWAEQRELSDEEYRATTWTREAEERLASAWEKYLTTGQAPNEQLRGIFERLATLLRDVYRLFQRKPYIAKIDIKPEVRAAFDRMLTPQEGLQAQERELRKQTDTPEFKKWFGDSKVVDEKGEPLVVYHGTGGDFDVFDMSKGGKNFGQVEPFAFFSNDREMASRYAVHAQQVGGTANVIPAYVSLQNPFIIEENTDGRGEIKLIENYKGLLPDVRDALAGDEYDGVIARDIGSKNIKGDPFQIIIAKFPTQIKSAIGNRGTFEPANPNILQSQERQGQDDELRSMDEGTLQAVLRSKRANKQLRRRIETEIERRRLEEIASRGGGRPEAGGRESAEQEINAEGLPADFQPITPSEPILGAPNPISGYSATAYRMRTTASPDDAKKPLPAKDVILALGDVVKAAGKVVPIRYGRIRGKELGHFQVMPEVIRVKTADDIPTAAHEVAHALEKAVYGYPKGSPWVKPLIGVKMQRELTALGKALYGNTRPNGGYLREGFAEYVAYYILSDEAGNKAPTFHKWFEGTFLKDYPEVNEALQDAKKLAKQFSEQGSVKRAKAGVVQSSVFDRAKQAIRSARSRFVRAHVESADPLGKIVESAEKLSGRRLPIERNPFLSLQALRLTHTARTRYMADNGMIDIAGNVVGGSLREAVAPVQKNRDEFTIYLWARRAKELWNPKPRVDKDGNPIQVKSRNPGLSIDDAEYIIDFYEKSPEGKNFQLAASKVYEWNRGVLNYMKQAGLLTDDQYDAITSANENYMPMQRVFDELDEIFGVRSGSGAGKVLGKNPIMRLKGSGRRIREPFTVMIEQAEKYVRASHQKIVVDQLLKLRKVEGMGKLIEEVPRSMVPHAVDFERVIAEVRKAGVTVDIPNPDDLVGKMVTFFSPAYAPKGPHPIIAAVEDGQIKWFEVHNDLYKALSSLDVYRLPKWADLLFGAPARAFRLGTTGLRASFSLVTNPARDLPTFLAQSTTKKNAAVLTKAWISSLAEAFRESVTGKRSELFDAFVRLGGQMAQPLGPDTMQTRRAAGELFEGRMMRILTHPVEHLRDLLQFPESSPRIAEMREKADEVGGTPMTLEQSLALLLAAKRSTVDFTAAGDAARSINQVVPFWNAAVQSMRSFGRAFKENPSRALAYGGVMITMPTLALWLLNRDKEWWKDMPWREKYGFWHIELPDGNVIRIPRPFEWGMTFGSMIEGLIDTWYREDPRSAVEAVNNLQEIINPGIAVETEKTGGFPIPYPEAVPARIGVEQLMNKQKFSGAPIVPRGEEELRPAEQYGKYTSEAAKTIGKVFNISPRRLDHAFRGIFGGAGGDVLRGYDALADFIGGKKIERSELPVVGTLFRRGGTEGERSQAVEDLYNALDKAVERQRSRERQETPDERQARLLLKDAADAVSALRFVRDNVDDLDKRQEMMREIRRIAQDALSATQGYVGEGKRSIFKSKKRQAEAEEARLKPAERERVF